jgi:hypothetical protein
MLVLEPEGKRQFEKLGIDGRRILKWALGKWGWRVWIGLTWLRIRTSGGSCEHGNESCFLRNGVFLDYLSVLSGSQKLFASLSEIATSVPHPATVCRVPGFHVYL